MGNVMIAAESINAVMLFVPSIESFFAQLLSISGIFLMMEFGIDARYGINVFRSSILRSLSCHMQFYYWPCHILL